MDINEAIAKLFDAGGLTKETVKPILSALLASDDCEDDDKRYVAALAYGLESGYADSPGDISESSYDETTFDIGRGEFRVLTDGEADEACKEYIEQSLWAFNADFLAGETGIDSDVFKVLSEKCESGNDGILSLVTKTCGLDSLAESATSSDGRGHFLAGYDGEENEQGDFFIYRTN